MKNQVVTVLSLIGIIVILLIGLLFMGSETKISALDFIQKYKNTPGSILVDVRTPGEFLSGHIDGAINIDIQNPSFMTEVVKLDTSKTYFVYCRSGNRSQQAVFVMKANGIQNIYELKGGIISNTDTVKLVTVNSVESEYVVDASDMVDGNVLISNIKKLNFQIEK